MKIIISCLLVLAAVPCFSQQPSPQPTPASPAAYAQERILPGAKIYIAPMDGFEAYLSAAILKKNVPVAIVDDAAKADFVVGGTSHVDKASWAKTIFISGASSAGASVTFKDAKTGNLVFAYSVDKFNAARANQSTAEACAKHLKQFIEKK